MIDNASFASTYLSSLLKRTELFDDDQIEKILFSVRNEDKNIAEAVVHNGLAKEDDFLEAIATLLKTSFVKLGSTTIDQETLDMLPPKAVFQYNVIPISVENGVLLVASNDPFNPGLLDSLRLAAGVRVRLVLSTSDDIAKAARKLYGVGADTVDKMMQDNRFDVADDLDMGKMDLGDLDQEASIVKFVNQIIWEACRQGSTDIHFEPMEEQLRIRYRVDGVLHQTPVPGQLNRFQAAIISRIKVMANLDIAEKRLPMDGRIGLRVEGQNIDIRVSTMPTSFGESVSLRLLQSGGEIIGLRASGMSEKDCLLIRKIIHRPNGIVLVTGPTGSGKSTSLYSYLKEINTIDQRILTAENPIEYQMSGINQVLVRPEIGLTFSRALRSFLRQDPDVIMVGEIRDQETAEIAIQASLTGHLVFSTLHTNDAAGAFTRLLDMGVEPFLVASAVEAVVAQRLVRRLCKTCRQRIEPKMVLLNEIEFPIDQLANAQIYTSGSCEECRNTGFHGRVGIFEVLQVTETIESLVIAHSSSGDIKHKALSEGMTTLRKDGWDKVMDGTTTVEEVLRVTEDS